MTTTGRRRQANDFDIHEDGPSTEDTEMNTDAAGEEGTGEEDIPEEVEEVVDGQDDEEQLRDLDPKPEPEPEPESEPEQEQEEDDFSDDGDEAMDEDMHKLQDAFPGFKHKYRLIKRIGEGTVPSFYGSRCFYLHPISRHILHRL